MTIELNDINTDGTDALADIQAAPQTTCFSTPLVDITFKTVQIGDSVVDGPRTFFAANTINGVADQFCQIIARTIHDIQVTVAGHEAIATKTVPELKDMFDDQGKLQAKFAATKSATQIMRAENYYASLSAHWESLGALSAAHNEMMVNQKLQFAFVSRANADTMYEAGAIYDFKEAIKFRMKRMPARVAIFETAQRVREGKARTLTMQQASAAEILSF